MQKRNYVAVAVGMLGICLASSNALAQCACTTDVVGGDAAGPFCGASGTVDITDVIEVTNCVNGLPTVCTGGCDVNCDGVEDYQDVSAVVAAFGGDPNPCAVPTGSCCTDDQRFPGCLVSSENFCLNFAAGTYGGDGTTCNPSPCDCNNNGVDDGVDIANATSDDCNTNGIPDECEFGACCFKAKTCAGSDIDGTLCRLDRDCGNGTCTGPGATACFQGREAECMLPEVNGTWQGPCAECPSQNAAIIQEGDGSIFVHFVGPPVDCPSGPIVAQSTAACTGAPFQDLWVTDSGGMVCHNFGVTGSPAIPADFFGPGSDPFSGQVCLMGVPLGGAFGNADTVVSRTADPFDRCVLPSATPATVDIEIVALSLVSINPVTITFNGGLTPQDWVMNVDLSPSGLLPGTPQSTLTATKTHCNGGTYDSTLYVQPRFTFTRTAETDRVLDTFVENIPATPLVQNAASPWVSDVDPALAANFDHCTDFHAGLEEVAPTVNCDCNSNTVRDVCDILQGTSADCNTNNVPDACDIASGFSLDVDTNGVPDECPAVPIPAASTWGLLVMTLLLLAAGTILVTRVRRPSQQ